LSERPDVSCKSEPRLVLLDERIKRAGGVFAIPLF
jgi:hypothetical protein